MVELNHNQKQKNSPYFINIFLYISMHTADDSSPQSDEERQIVSNITRSLFIGMI